VGKGRGYDYERRSLIIVLCRKIQEKEFTRKTDVTISMHSLEWFLGENDMMKNDAKICS